MHKVCIQSQNETNGFPIFVIFCPVKSIQQLADGPTIYVGSQDQRICFISSANQLSLSLTGDSLLAFRLEAPPTKNYNYAYRIPSETQSKNK